jgi:hypothetical protein
MLSDQKSETWTAAYTAYQIQVDAIGMGYQIILLRCDDGQGEYDNMTFRWVLTACGTTSEQCPPDSDQKNGVAERMIRTITKKA